MKRLLLALLACQALACASSSGSAGPSLKDKPRPQSYFVGEAGRNWYYKGKSQQGVVEVGVEVGGQLEVEGKPVTVIATKIAIRTPVGKIYQYATSYYSEQGDDVLLLREDELVDLDLPAEVIGGGEKKQAKVTLYAPPSMHVKKTMLKPGMKWPLKGDEYKLKELSGASFLSFDRLTRLATDASLAPANAKKSAQQGEIEVVGTGKLKVPAGEFDAVAVKQPAEGGAAVVLFFAKGIGVVRQQIVMGAARQMDINLIEMDTPKVTEFMGDYSGKARLDAARTALGAATK